MTQQNLAHNQTVKNLSMSTQTEVEDDTESSNDIMMTDKSVRCISVSKEKKLAKKLKNQVKKTFKKLLILFIK